MPQSAMSDQGFHSFAYRMFYEALSKNGKYHTTTVKTEMRRVGHSIWRKWVIWTDDSIDQEGVKACFCGHSLNCHVFYKFIMQTYRIMVVIWYT